MDNEIKIMKRAWKLVGPLSPEARCRVFDYLAQLANTYPAQGMETGTAETLAAPGEA